MRNAASILALILAASAITACGKSQSAENTEMTIDGNVAAGELPPNAEIETLPPDESSVASNGELAKGDDNPDVNDLGNSH